MKKISTTLTFLLLTTFGVFAQTTLVNFDGVPYNQGAWNGTAEVVTNPQASGINTSTNVCKYTIPAGLAWSNCAWVIMDNPIKYKDLAHVEFMVKAPSATEMMVKLESESLAGETQPSAKVTPLASSDWQLVTLNFSGLTDEEAETATFDKFAFFFNVHDGVGGEEWFYDNVVMIEKVTTDIDGVNSLDGYALKQNYPNPVVNHTNISFEIPNATVVSLKVYNMQGAQVAELAGKEFLAGKHTIEFNAEGLAYGVYFYTIKADQFMATRKMFVSVQ